MSEFRPRVRIVASGGGATRRWWIAEQSLAGLLARGPFGSAREAWQAASAERKETVSKPADARAS